MNSLRSVSRLTVPAMILLALLTASPRAAADSTAKREMRGLWIATVWGLDWPSKQGTSASIRSAQQAQLAALLDRCKSLNLTTVCFQVRGMADALCRAHLEPWSSVASGKRGVDPGWDPLEWVVSECHARGLEW